MAMWCESVVRAFWGLRTDLVGARCVKKGSVAPLFNALAQYGLGLIGRVQFCIELNSCFVGQAFNGTCHRIAPK